MENEIWKDIENYEGVYQVSNIGNIKRLKTFVTHPFGGKKLCKEKTLKQGVRAGYKYIDLCFLNVHRKILTHRAVAIAFIPNPENKPQVNHINGIKTDNRIENLEWATGSENSLHSINILHKWVNNKGSNHGYSKLSDIQVINIRRSKQTDRETAKIFNVSSATINNIRNHKTWKHL